MMFPAFVGLVRRYKTNLRSGKRTIVLFIDECNDYFWLSGSFNVELILRCKRWSYVLQTNVSLQMQQGLIVLHEFSFLFLVFTKL